MRIPRGWLRHRITVEPYAGATGNGPVYGQPVAVPCHLERTRRTARTTDGRDVGDSTTAYCQLDAAGAITPEARVTVDGRVVEIVSVTRQDWPRGPTPNHLEVRFL